MDLKALEQGYNSVYILLPLGSIFNFNFNRKYSSPNCHSKSRHFAQHHRARLKPNLEPSGWFRRVYVVHINPEPP